MKNYTIDEVKRKLERKGVRINQRDKTFDLSRAREMGIGSIGMVEFLRLNKFKDKSETRKNKGL